MWEGKLLPESRSLQVGKGKPLERKKKESGKREYLAFWVDFLA